MKKFSWVMAILYFILWTIAVSDLVPLVRENGADVFFWRMVAMCSLGYIIGIYERLQSEDK